MNTVLVPLRLREPLMRWLLIAVLAALVLHGLQWLMIATLVFGGDSAVGEAQRQMSLALAWMIGAVILWRVNPPQSRLHALALALGCVTFVAVIGSVFRLLTLFLGGAVITGEVLIRFAWLAGPMLLVQLFAALPSAALLQGVALTRRTQVQTPEPPAGDYESG